MWMQAACVFERSLSFNLAWAPAEIFVGGGGGGPKKDHHIENKKSKKSPHMVKQAPHNEKNIAKRPPLEKRK